MLRTLRISTMLPLAFATPAFAQLDVPDTFGLQGFIHSASGAPVEADVSIETRIYSAQAGGTLLFTETNDEVPVTGSRFAVQVGAAGSFPTGQFTSITELFAMTDEVWAAVAIDGNAELPRQRMVTNAFSFRAQFAQAANTLTCDACVATSQLADGSVSAAKLGEACADSQVLKSSGGAWVCGDDEDTQLSAESSDRRRRAMEYLIWPCRSAS